MEDSNRRARRLIEASAAVYLFLSFFVSLSVPLSLSPPLALLYPLLVFKYASAFDVCCSRTASAFLFLPVRPEELPESGIRGPEGRAPGVCRRTRQMQGCIVEEATGISNRPILRMHDQERGECG